MVSNSVDPGSDFYSKDEEFKMIRDWDLGLLRTHIKFFMKKLC